MHITSQYLVSEEKTVMATSKVEALKAEASSLRKDLIVAMDDNNSSKEKIKNFNWRAECWEVVGEAKRRAIGRGQPKNEECRGQGYPCFSLMEEYNAILFGWYFKGFELLRRYQVKHGSGVDLEDLDFEANDKEIEADKAAQASQAAIVAGDDPLESEKDGNDASTT